MQDYKAKIKVYLEKLDTFLSMNSSIKMILIKMQFW